MVPLSSFNIDLNRSLKNESYYTDSGLKNKGSGFYRKAKKAALSKIGKMAVLQQRTALFKPTVYPAQRYACALAVVSPGGQHYFKNENILKHTL